MLHLQDSGHQVRIKDEGEDEVLRAERGSGRPLHLHRDHQRGEEDPALHPRDQRGWPREEEDLSHGSVLTKYSTSLSVIRHMSLFNHSQTIKPCAIRHV